MSLNKLLIIFFLLVVNIMTISGQEIDLTNEVTANLVQEEIDKRGLNEEEVRTALLEAGYNLDDLSTIGPEEFPKIQSIIESLSDNNENEENNNDIKDIEITEVKTKPNKEQEVQETEIKVVIEDTETKKENPEIYGHRMFINKEISFYSNRDGIRAPDHYILGEGDELSISIFGDSYKEGTHIINNKGYIQILNNMKKVSLKGMTLGQARVKLKRIFSGYYKFRDGEFSISLNYSRPISISVLGEVMNPGSITLPAINNVFNALAAVNGPNKIGSIRKIQVIRKNGQLTEVDLFDYINNPSSNKSFFLSDNDKIIVPPSEVLVDVSGAINRPMLYELKKGEGIKTLVDFAGGFSKSAYTKSLKVKRIKNNEFVFIDIDYSNNAHFKLENGDEVNIKLISTNLTNYVGINGTVSSQGQYQRNKGMRILDLVKKAGLRPESKTDLIYLRRISNDNKFSYIPINLDEILNNPNMDSNLVLEDKDELTLWSKDLFFEKGSVIVSGAVRDSVSIEVNGSEDLTIRNAIMLAGGLSMDASLKGLLYRKERSKINKIEYIDINLEDGNASLDYNMKLMSNDQLVIFSNELFSDKNTISVLGAVNNPGNYTYGTGMTLKQALLLAKGLSISAAKNRIEISRTIIKDNTPTQVVIATLTIDEDFNVLKYDAEFELLPYDNIFVREVADFEMQKTITLSGEFVHPGDYTIINDNETISDVIKRAGGLTAEGFPTGASLYREEEGIGYLIIRLDEVLENKKSRFNFKIRGGDIIEVPKINDFVTVQGATNVKYSIDEKLINKNQSIKVPFQKGKRLKYYIEEYAGGFDKNADRKKVSVKYPNGGIKRARNYILFWKYPEVTTGSTIVVGYKPVEQDDQKGEKKAVDWDKIVNNTVSQATTLLTLLAVTKSLNN